jgi:hypothetical protein
MQEQEKALEELLLTRRSNPIEPQQYYK